MRPQSRLALRVSGLTAGLAAMFLTGLTLAVAPASAAAPETDFEMPFPCGEEWTGTTRSSHSPSPNSVDWNRLDDVNDPVVASAAGTVRVAEPSGRSGYGNWVMIDHEAGESTIYAHLTTVVVLPGQTVERGTQVGTVGTTGNSTGPHLHYEQRRNGSVIAPWFNGSQFWFGSTQASANCAEEPVVVDVPVAGNLLGDASAEVGVFRKQTPGSFRIHRPERRPRMVEFGSEVDLPVLGDWDGDGRANVGVRTPATRTFWMQTPAGTSTLVFGRVRDLPVAGDWDGDGTWEVGVRRKTRSLFRLRAADGTVTRVRLGDTDDLPVTGDWDGDGRTDLGVYDSATATYTLRVADSNRVTWTAQVRFGKRGDLPVTGDWDGNGRTDVGVWNPETAVFSQRRAPGVRSTAVTSVTRMQAGTPR